MITERFINFEYNSPYMDHDDTYPHEHHHTPAKLASHEYIKCMHEKNNESECKAASLRVYEENISAEQKYKDCMSNAKTAADKRLCQITFNKSNEYSYSNALSAYEVGNTQYCMRDEMEKSIKNNCINCKKNSELTAEEDILYKNCMNKRQECINSYDDAKKCIDELKNGETEECLRNAKYNILYGKCHENKGLDLLGIIVSILTWLAFPIKKGIFYLIYFMFTVMSVVFFGGLFFVLIWGLVVFMYTILGNKGTRAFPGIIVYGVINQYFRQIHPFVLLFVGLAWAFLFGICILLYFFKKTFGWWPATWVWKAIGIFPGNEKPVFKWFDRMFGCTKKSGRKALFCHNNNLWILMEDWMVEFAQKVLRIDKTEVEIKNAINAFKDLGDEDIKIQYSISKMAEESKNKTENKAKETIVKQANSIETFTNDIKSFKTKGRYIEETFIFNFDKDDMSKLDKFTKEFSKFTDIIDDAKQNFNKQNKELSDSSKMEEQASSDREAEEEEKKKKLLNENG